jgi:hypothetical protein
MAHDGPKKGAISLCKTMDFYGFSDPTRQWEKHIKMVHILLNESAKRPGREKK